MALRSARSKRSEAGGAPGAAANARSGRSVTAPGAHPALDNWLVRGKDGRLTAFARTADGIAWWTETAVGGPYWSGPEQLPSRGRPLHLSVAQSTEGYTHLVVMRERPAPDGGKPLTDFIYAVQFQTGRPLRDWQTLGNPYKDREKAGRFGELSTLVDPKGALHVYVRNADGRVSVKQQVPKGRFGAWTTASVEGSPVTGEVFATVTDTGAIDVLGPAAGTVLHWGREKFDADIVRDEDAEPAARMLPGTISAERTGTGRLTHFWRDASTTKVTAWRPGADPLDLGGPGAGPVMTLRTPVDGVDCTILAGRGSDGRPVLAAYPTEDEGAGLTWVSSGEPCRGTPALALDGGGRIVLAAIGDDGRLRVTRQKPEQGLALEAWNPAEHA